MNMTEIKLYLTMDVDKDQANKLCFEIEGIYHPTVRMKKDQSGRILVLELAVPKWSDDWFIKLARKFDIEVDYVQRD